MAPNFGKPDTISSFLMISFQRQPPAYSLIIHLNFYSNELIKATCLTRVSHVHDAQPVDCDMKKRSNSSNTVASEVEWKHPVLVRRCAWVV